MLETSTRLTALIADDDEYFRMALTRILRERLGFADVIQTGSFDEAIDRLERAGNVTIAIFDLFMPGIDSPAALRMIRQSFDVDRLAVVSGSRKRSDVLASLEAGVHGFVSKSQGAVELQSALRQILEGTVYVPPTLADIGSEGDEVAGAAAYTGPKGEDPHLTPRQREVLEMLIKGKSTKEIARALDLGPGTVKVHLAALFRNLGVGNRAAAAAVGARLLGQSGSTPEISAA